MSQINNVITTTFRARGNQAIAQMGSITQGFGRVGHVINENTRLSERLNNQWRALGTTIRYAIAGTAVFGLTRMIGQLRDVQTQMGLISAIGEQAGGGPITGVDLSQLMGETRQGAVSALTPINQYNDAVINLLSTIQGVPRDQITPMVTEISRAAKLAQVSAEDATKAFTTMNVAFGEAPNLENIHRMAQEFFILTREAPGGVAAGQQVITQLGQLAQVTKAAHGTPQDMFSLLLTTLRSGIPPAQAGRGLQYMIQTLAFPGQQTKQSREALESLGITSTTTMPLQQRLSLLFGHARKLGITGNVNKIRGLDEETLADLEAQGTTGGLASMGITGRGAEFLGSVFHRIHALRTALAISGGIDVGSAQKDLETMNQAAQGHVSEVNSLAEAWKRFHKQAKLQEASIAINAMALQVAQIFEPVLNFTAGRITGLQEIMQRHPQGARAAVIGGGAMVAALGLGRMFNLGKMSAASPLGYLVNRIPGLSRLLTSGGGGIGQALVMANAAQAAMGGNSQIGGSPQNPLYVVVVGQLFGGSGGGIGGGSRTPLGGGGPGAPERIAEDVTAMSLGRRLARRAGGLFGRVGRLGTRIAGTRVGLRAAESGLLRGALKFGGPIIAAEEYFRNADPTNVGEQEWINQTTRARELAARLGVANPNKILGAGNLATGTMRGHAEVWMTIDIQQPGGKVERRRVHVPVSLWEGGRHPGQGGKPGNRRSR